MEQNTQDADVGTERAARRGEPRVQGKRRRLLPEHGVTVSFDLAHRAASLARITATTRFVHVVGHLPLWGLREILARAPSIANVRVTPRVFERIRASQHATLCRAHGVMLMGGWVEPPNNRRGEERRYRRAREEFLEVLAYNRDAFNELRATGSDAAEIAARYFRLAGEPRATQQEIGIAFGYKPAGAQEIVSDKIHAVLLFLNPKHRTNITSRGTARALHARVARTRRLRAERDAVERVRARFTQRYGVELPGGLPVRRHDAYERLLLAARTGALAALEERDANAHRALTLRFGLDAEHRYRTLENVGDRMGVSRERIRQLEARALAALGIPHPR